MATTTINSGGAWLNRTSGSIITAGDFTIIGASKWSAAVVGNFPCVFALQGVTGGPTSDWVELFQDDPNGANDIEQTWTITSGGAFASLGSNAALVGKWIHWAYSYVASTSTCSIYAILEGINQTTPVFLLNTSPVTKVPINNQTILWNDNGGDFGFGVSVGHWIITAQALNQAQVLAQMAQRAPTAATLAASYSYLDMSSLATVSTDLGTLASNFTQNANSGGTAFTIDPTQPSDWAAQGFGIPAVALSYVTA